MAHADSLTYPERQPTEDLESLDIMGYLKKSLSCSMRGWLPETLNTGLAFTYSSPSCC